MQLFSVQIKGNPTRESTSNVDLQSSKSKSQLMDILLCHMIVTNTTQPTTTKVTSQASNLTTGSGIYQKCSITLKE